MVNRARLKAYAAALAVFVLGAVTGGAASHAFSEHRHRELVAGGPEAFERRKLHAMARKLELSDEQAAGIRKLLREERETRRKLTEEVFARCGESLDSHRDKTDQRIRALLSPEQQKRYEAIVREHRHDPFRGPPPGGPPPRPGHPR